MAIKKLNERPDMSAWKTAPNARGQQVLLTADVKSVQIPAHLHQQLKIWCATNGVPLNQNLGFMLQFLIDYVGLDTVFTVFPKVKYNSILDETEINDKLR